MSAKSEATTEKKYLTFINYYNRYGAKERPYSAAQ